MEVRVDGWVSFSSCVVTLILKSNSEDPFLILLCFNLWLSDFAQDVLLHWFFDAHQEIMVLF